MKSGGGPWQENSGQREQYGKDPEGGACQATHAPGTAKRWMPRGSGCKEW